MKNYFYGLNSKKENSEEKISVTKNSILVIIFF